MNTITQESRAKRNAAALEDWFENAFSYADIERKYGLSRAGMVKLLARDEAQNGPRERKIVAKQAAQKIAGRKPLSRQHAMVGVAVGRYMEVNKLSLAQMGDLVGGLTAVGVTKVRTGVHPLELELLLRLSSVLSISLNQLLEGKEKVLVN